MSVLAVDLSPPGTAGSAPADTATAAARHRLRPGGVWAWSPLFAVALWQLASSTGLLPARLLASLPDGALPRALLASVQRVAVGFTVGALAGVALGLSTGLSRWADQLLDPVLQALRTLPFLGLVPLLIMWFGIGELPKVFLVAFGEGVLPLLRARGLLAGGAAARELMPA